MTSAQQRFCPLCDRSFSDGEAVLRCEGCGVMHHPACWVKNGGCATKTDHQSVPIALAYSAERPMTGQAPHPGEGTRVAAPREPIAPPPAAVAGRGASGRSSTPPPADEMIIGEPDPAERSEEPVAASRPERRKPPVAPKQYVAGPGGRKGMPRIYGRNRILGYWYIPAAILVAAGVALGVIWAFGALTGDDDTPASASGDETPTSAAGAGATQTAAASPTSPTEEATSTGGIFEINDQVVITGVGQGSASEPGCLNIRTAPGTDNPIIDCLPDGTQLTILSGPQEAGGLTWWNVKLPSGDGWAAEEYLVAQ